MSQQLNTETLPFKIGLSGTFWAKRPDFSVWVNDKKYYQGTIAGESGQVEYVEFSADVAEDQEHKLIVRLENKTDLDTVVDDAEIVKDMLLNIETIKIDDIDLDVLRWNESVFYPDDASRQTIEACVNLGWNGAYTLTFSSPFYLWLLEKL
jgi:hypothetical protein